MATEKPFSAWGEGGEESASAGRAQGSGPHPILMPIGVQITSLKFLIVRFNLVIKPALRPAITSSAWNPLHCEAKVSLTETPAYYTC